MRAVIGAIIAVWILWATVSCVERSMAHGQACIAHPTAADCQDPEYRR